MVLNEETPKGFPAIYEHSADKAHIRGFIDDKKAMEQAIYKIIFTERYRYPIYSWNYGIELQDLFGEPVSFVIPEIKRRIREALLWDDRVLSVDGFKFETGKGTVSTEFTVKTIFGEFIVKRSI
jgi:hypothetical protein